jgi:hypothetical protein
MRFQRKSCKERIIQLPVSYTAKRGTRKHRFYDTFLSKPSVAGVDHWISIRACVVRVRGKLMAFSVLQDGFRRGSLRCL